MQVPVHSYLPLDMQVVVKDKQGRRFDNFSSLSFDWSLSDKTLAKSATGSNDVETKTFTNQEQSSLIVSKWRYL